MTAYLPGFNDAMKILIKTLLVMAQTLRLHLDELRYDLLGEEINIACTLQNQLLKQGCICKRTPYKVINNRLRSVEYCRIIFGGRTYFHRQKH